MFVINLIVLLLILFLIGWLWRRKSLYLLSLKMPGPIGIPFIGSVMSYLMQGQGNLLFVEKLCKRYTSPFCVWFGPVLYVVFTNSEHIRLVLTSCDFNNRADVANKVFRDAIGGDGIFTLEDKRWKKSRHIIAPSFNYNIIVEYIPVFEKESKDLVRQLRKYVGLEPFNICDIVEQATIMSFFRSIFASDISPEVMEKYAEIVSETHKLIAIRMVSPWYESDFIWNLTKYGKRLNKLQKGADEIRDYLRSSITNKSDNTTLLQRLFRKTNENEHFTIDEIVWETTGLLLGGTVSTTGPITITLLLLAMHEDVQEKVFEELRHILPNQNSIITNEDLQKMHYLDMCVQEELRLFPSVPITVRKSSQSFQLENYEIPAGMPIFINFYQLHRNPEYWGANSNKFDPNNFLPDNIAKIKPYSYMPFGLGGRNCIGKAYSMIVIKTMLANILRNYKVTTTLKYEDLSIHSAIAIVVNDSCLMVQLEPRNV